MTAPNLRPVRVVLPADLDDRVQDAVSAGLGGFHSKHALVASALDAYLIDLQMTNGTVSGGGVERLGGPDCRSTREIVPRVKTASQGAVVTDDASILVEEPLLGLHNRDWPSLWVLGELAEATAGGPVAWGRFLTYVTARAWQVAEQIAAVFPDTARKATALLPTNREKVQSAESAFQSFAIADVARRSNGSGRFLVSGPLPLWQAIAFVRPQHELLVGVTESGWELLNRLDGTEPLSPHPIEAAHSFFEHLRHNATIDWWGFDTMVTLLRQEPTREQYLEGFRTARQWKASIADSAAQGYLARGREWGLAEPKMIQGHYLLTAFGREI